LRGFFRRSKGEKSKKYFVYFKILKRSCGGKGPQGAEAAFDQRLLIN